MLLFSFVHRKAQMRKKEEIIWICIFLCIVYPISTFRNSVEVPCNGHVIHELHVTDSVNCAVGTT
jgi:hypothetical protein